MEDNKRPSKVVAYIHNNTDEVLLSFEGTMINLPENNDLVIIKDKAYKVIKKNFAYENVEGTIYTEIVVLVEDYNKENNK